jgi:hypothetical protein
VGTFTALIMRWALGSSPLKAGGGGGEEDEDDDDSGAGAAAAVLA